MTITGFGYDEERRAIVNSVDGVLKQFAPRKEEIKRMIHKEHKFPQEIWDAISKAGYLGCLIPEEFGGNAMGMLPLTWICETLAVHGYGNAIFILTNMDAACILRNGSDAMKRKWLPQIASGKTKFCFAITEPNAGSNAFRIETHAKKEGNVYKLNGQKTFITGADVADMMLLVTRTTTVDELKKAGMSKAYGMSLFLVDTKSKGLRLQPLATKGIEGLTQFQLFFDDVEVPAENLVGEENNGSLALFNSLNPERILAAASALGMTRYLIGRSVEYAKERKLFRDTPIGAYQAIQHPLAELRIEEDAVRLLTYRAAWAFDEGLPPADVGTFANMAKLKAADMAIRAADVAIETHGGYGFSEDYGIIWYWDAARLLKTAPISREMILNFVSEHTLGLPRSY